MSEQISIIGSIYDTACATNNKILLSGKPVVPICFFITL